ncbi:hypothetical protein Zm00014a_037166 [Zea mays]|uniref:Uncharacterized protein n=1 Tax=Zea mays TaxID=4577 RepID=A0A3L6FV57_MAIZE|nr:hypothetical protein Zm00014a_037166 [Zea mays]
MLQTPCLVYLVTRLNFSD